MVITHQDEYSFKFQSGETSVLLNPTNSRSFKGAALALFTTFQKNLPLQKEGEVVIIAYPGEYEVKDIRITGWKSTEDYSLYHLVYDEIKISIISEDTSYPSPELIEGIGESDILIIPIGTKKGLSTTSAAKLIRAVEPALLLPVFEDAQEEKNFMKEFEGKIRTEEKLVLKKKDIVSGTLSIVKLTE